MSHTLIVEEKIDDINPVTGEFLTSTKRTVKKSKIEPSDEYIKVSKYLNTIFAYKSIPLTLVPIALLLAQDMEYRTNRIYLLKDSKERYAEMLDVSLDRINKLIKDCKTYDILRSTGNRGIYEVNPYLFSTGSVAETRELQAYFDFERDTVTVQAEQTNRITGKVVRKAVTNRKKQKNDPNHIPGQLAMDLQNGGVIEDDDT